MGTCEFARPCFTVDVLIVGDNNLRDVPKPTVNGGATNMATSPRPPDSDESFNIVFDREEDGRWIAEVPELPGVMAYGTTKEDAEIAVTALALRVIADHSEEVRKPPKSIRFQP